MVKTSYAIIGTGAVGGYYGALLQTSGREVHFLLHRDYEHVMAHGLRVESIHGDMLLPEINGYAAAEDMPRCDVVVVALKTTANRVLPRILPQVVKREGFVLMLQNGLGVEAEVAELVGPDRVMGGMSFLCSNKVGPGHIRHLDYGAVTLADYRPDDAPAGITPRMEVLGRNLERAGVPVRLLEDLAAARWRKLVWNIPFNGLSVVLNATTDRMVSDPDTRTLCRALMEEVQAGAAACARPIEDAFVDQMLTDTESMKPYLTSMKLDYDAGRPMEVEAIYGRPVQAARAQGIDMKRTASLCRQLREMDQARQAGQ